MSFRFSRQYGPSRRHELKVTIMMALQNLPPILDSIASASWDMEAQCSTVKKFLTGNPDYTQYSILYGLLKGLYIYIDDYPEVERERAEVATLIDYLILYLEMK